MTQSDVFASHEAVECLWLIEIERDVGRSHIVVGSPVGLGVSVKHLLGCKPAAVATEVACSNLCTLSKIGLEDLLNHLVECCTAHAVNLMDETIAIHWEVEQQCAVASHRLIVSVHQLRQALDMLGLAVMIEPSWAD